MTTAQWIFEQAMHLMDEGNEITGQADTDETRAYKHRTLPILNVLRVECSCASDTCQTEAGKRTLCPEIPDFESEIALDDGICQGVLPYGLAAHLLVEENPAKASYFQQRYEELLATAKGGIPAQSVDITNPYGGIEHGRYSYW